jgi:hypothetical protein
MIEYGPSVWQRFRDLDFAHYQLSDSEFAAAGNLRFLRDGLILLGSVAGSFVVGVEQRSFRVFLAWEALLVGIGTIGQTALPRPDLYVCGLRWVLNLHFAATAILILEQCSSRFWRAFEVTFGAALGALMLLLLAGLAYQWVALDYVLGTRLTSFLPQAEMVVELAQGLAFFAIAIGAPASLEALAMLQLVAAGFLTATRMAPVYAALLLARWPLFALARRNPVREAAPSLALLGLMIFGAVTAAALPLASLIAQRGSVLEQQFDSARLAGWPDEFRLMTEQSAATLLFGKGLGYRTTTAGTLHLNEKYGDPYIEGHENAIAALFAQVGAGGLVVVAAGVALLLRRLCDAAGDDPVAWARIAALVAVILVLSMAGYWYEWPLFVQPLAVGLASMLRRRG